MKYQKDYIHIKKMYSSKGTYFVKKAWKIYF